MEENLRTFFQQDYPNFEILFALRHPSDPAVVVVERLAAEFPRVSAHLLITGEPIDPGYARAAVDLVLARYAAAG